MPRSHRHIDPSAPRTRFGAAVLVAAVLLLGVIAACTPPPEAMPGPQRRAGDGLPVIPLRDAPWNATPPDRVLPLVPGAAPPADLHPALRRTAALTMRLFDDSLPIDERTQYLLERARGRLSVGGFGLPLSPQERWQLARQAIIFFELMHPQIVAGLSAPWAYSKIDADAFKQLLPQVQLGWQEALRLDDLLSILASGGTIVMLTRTDPTRTEATDNDAAAPARFAYGRKSWAFVAVWMPDQQTLAALDVVEMRPQQARP